MDARRRRDAAATPLRRHRDATATPPRRYRDAVADTQVADAGEEITFRGSIAASKSQAFFLTFVTLVSLLSLALVLQIQVPSVGNYWFLICLVSPYAGVFYWGQASENEDREFKVKLTANDDETETLMVLRGGKEDVERMEREMDLRQQGMVKVTGLFEGALK